MGESLITFQFERILAALDAPIYVFRQEPVGLVCDKLFNPKDNKFDRIRYVITGGRQCTCMSFMKSKDCKHLKMLRGDYDWVGDGVPSSKAVETVAGLVDQVLETLPESAKDWDTTINEDALSEQIRCVELSIKDNTKRKAERVVSIKKFPELKQKLALVFLFGA